MNTFLHVSYFKAFELRNVRKTRKPGIKATGNLIGHVLMRCVKENLSFQEFREEKRYGNRGEIWVFPKIGVPQNGQFIMENPIKMDDLGVPLFLETPRYVYEKTLPQNSERSHDFFSKRRRLHLESMFFRLKTRLTTGYVDRSPSRR